jgi:hypothetical protein
MQQDVVHQAVVAIEQNQLAIGASLIAGSISFWCLHGKPERQVFTLSFEPESLETTKKYIDFTKNQFQVGVSVEPSQFVEMSNGEVLSFRPTLYPLTSETRVVGVSLRRKTIPVEVVEIWADGEKQGYFDFRQNKYVASSTNDVGQKVIAAIDESAAY